ncbi:MAG: type II toxin-antitoxin system death-on-curing family toxin [Anaerolineae bacterium]|nr:type II toxin-antitoxin system death-on-curing family toxin [Anaerolineae bacterium]MDQ7036586.1 type II toxin-antitoxin system death-on-curing family toxin [Anaerolineae bacterium]
MNSQNDKHPDPEHILSANDLYNINSEVTDSVPFVRDHQLLRSAVRRPYLILFGEEQFPTIIDKAAATMHSLAAHHLFADGNKRTAIRASQLFLESNGFQHTWTDEEVAHFVLQIARGEIEVESVALWIAEHSK